MPVRNNKGFTLIEVIVVAGIIAVLAGILVPLIFKEIDESKNARAMADVKSMSSALFVLKKDTGQWPVSTTCNAAATLLQGAGTIPTLGASWDSTIAVTYDNFLSTDPGCYAAGVWKGPYMAIVNADPWGYKYVTNAPAMLSATLTDPIWIISAGPNGVVDTAVTDAAPCNGATPCDDIGVRLR